MSSQGYYGFTHTGTQYGNTYTPSVPASSSGSFVAPLASQSYANYDYSQASNGYAYTAESQNMSTAYPTNYGSLYVNQPVVSTENYGYSNTGQNYNNAYNEVVTDYASQVYGTGRSSEDFTPVYSNTSNRNNWNQYKKRPTFKQPEAQKAPQPLYYCDVCKISCAGPQSYNEHIAGQRHRKRETAGKEESSSSNKKGPALGLVFKCDLCNVSCTGEETYSAHIRGSKHQRAHALCQKLGKPIPELKPSMQEANKNGETKTPATAGRIKVLGTPVGLFLSGGRLRTTEGESSADAQQASTQSNNSESFQSETCYPNILLTSFNENLAQVEDKIETILPTEAVSTKVAAVELELISDIPPVGEEYVEDVIKEGRPKYYHCKLCACDFNDERAKSQHVRGKRHRLEYKKKVDPKLIVEGRQNMKPGKKEKQQPTKQNRYFQPDVTREHVAPNYGHQPHPAMPPALPHPPVSDGWSGQSNIGKPMSEHTLDDMNLFKKHSDIIPTEEELEDIEHVLAMVEKAIKLVSDDFMQEDKTAHVNQAVEKELASLLSSSTNAEDITKDNKAEYTPSRIVKGVMRVGLVPKNLLLSGDHETELVAICSEIPTMALLDRFVSKMPQKLKECSPLETFQVVTLPQEASLLVSSTSESKTNVYIRLTSPALLESRADEMVKDNKQLLDRQKCLDALAALRRAKWYQVKVADLHPCAMMIRIYRDLARRTDTWSHMSTWAIELLCERVMSSAAEPLTPSQAMRHILEAIASGIMLPGADGLLDPCEKVAVDVFAYLTKQQREDITSSAQHALRLLAFRHIHKILGIEPVTRFSRKRKPDQNSEAGPSKAEKMKITTVGSHDDGAENTTEPPAEGQLPSN
ncbi:Zinc finger RNA-binding protein [Halotydeus destructor]|nr:Zinc finger RNA-binding protein [Halotydeus destructor]